MRLKPENKRKITHRITESAAAAFRAHGYDAVNIDTVMHGAGLTRGAFYAHFKSKADLFCAVVRTQNPLLHKLRRRSGETAQELAAQMLSIFRDYLNPAHLPVVSKGCTLAALTGDVARVSNQARTAYQAAWQELLNEMARGQATPGAAFMPLLVLATGAVRSAGALQSREMRAQLLNISMHYFEHMMEDIMQQGSNE